MGGSIQPDVLRGVPINWPDGFLTFALERYAILERRRSGQPFPWTDDPILRDHRFTNVFRDDDTVTQFIHTWVDARDDVGLLKDLTYARLCNEPSTMLATGRLSDPGFDPVAFIAVIDCIGGGKTKAKVNKNPVWRGPYQVAGAFKLRLGYPYREQLIAYHVPKIAGKLAEVIRAQRGQSDLKPYLDALGAVWGYRNDTVFVQVLLDLASLRPDLVPSTCRVPPSSGVEPLCVALGITQDDLVTEAQRLWNERHPRRMELKDAEHALCEWRKYIVWKHGLSKRPNRYRVKAER